MNADIEQKIRTEIERRKADMDELNFDKAAVGRIGSFVVALEWVLSLAKPQEAATDDDEKIVEAIALAHRNEHSRCYGRDEASLDWWRKQGCWKHELTAARAAFAVAREHLVPQARAKALDDALFACWGKYTNHACINAIDALKPKDA